MYQNINTGEVWKLSHVETDRYFPDGITKAYKKIYVFENGERRAEDLFFKYWRKVDGAQQSVYSDAGDSSQ